MVQSSAHWRRVAFLLIGLAVFYAFFNGYRNSSSILAGVLASRAMRAAPLRRGRGELVAPFPWVGGGARGDHRPCGCDAITRRRW
jgi:hypothetical protein